MTSSGENLLLDKIYSNNSNDNLNEPVVVNFKKANPELQGDPRQ